MRALADTPNADSATVIWGHNSESGYTKAVNVKRDGSLAIKSVPFPSNHNTVGMPVSSVRELGELVKWLEDKPAYCIIRGGHPDNIDGPTISRTKRVFAEVPRRWMMLDFDNTPVPPGKNATDDTRDLVRSLIKQLPPEFQGVAHFVQLSASAGFKVGTISVHVFFWLDRPVFGADLKRWAKDLNSRRPARLIDPAVFGRTQPHYTARPRLSGVNDPFPGERRSWFVAGDRDEVAIVIPEAPALPIRAGISGQRISAVGTNGFLALMGDGVEGLIGFHEPIVRAAASLYSRGSVPDESRDQWKQSVRAAIDKAPKQGGRNDDILRYKSDAFLDPLLDHFDGLEGDKIKRAIVPQAAIIDFPSELDAKEAKIQLQAAVSDWVRRSLGRAEDDQPVQMLIKGAAGLGKTSTSIETLARCGARYSDLSGLSSVSRLNVDIYVPSGDNALELAEKLRATLGDKTPVDIIRGRSAIVEGVHLCRRHKLAEAAALAGIDVTKRLCKGERDDAPSRPCPHLLNCGYIGQFGYRGEAVRVLMHAHLPVRHQMRLPSEPDLIIIDEAFHQVACRNETFSLADLRKHLMVVPGLDPNADAVCPAIADMLVSGAPLLDALRAAGLTAPLLRAAAGSIYTPVETLPFGDDDDQMTAALTSRERRAGAKICRMLEALADEIGYERGQSNAVYLRGQTVHVAWHLKLGLRNQNVLFLDASGEPEIAKIFLPYIATVELPVARKGYVTQVKDKSFSNAALGLPFFEGGANPLEGTDIPPPEPLSLLALSQVLIDREARKGGRVLVVASKKVARRLKTPPNGALAHFGALRGKDGYRDFDVVIVIGRELPSISALEGQTRALFSDHPDPVWSATGWELVAHPFRMRDGAAVAALVQSHPCPLVNKMLHGVREAEIEQAIDRLRLVHAETPKRVLILTSTPTGVTVDRLVPWTDLEPTRSEVALHQTGVAPLSAPECTRLFPEFWPSRDAAMKGMQRDRDKVDNLFIELSIEGNVHFFEVTYRRPGQVRGRPSRALVSGPNPEAVVAAVVGPHRLIGVKRLTEAGADNSAKAA